MLPLTYLAGLLSCLLPCVLPPISSYFGVLGGSRFAWTRALAFITGFALVFLALGAAASFLNQCLASHEILPGCLGSVLNIALRQLHACRLRCFWPSVRCGANHGRLADGPREFTFTRPVGIGSVGHVAVFVRP